MTDLLKSVYDPEFFRKEGHALIDLLADYLHAQQQDPAQKALPWLDPETQWQFWKNDLQNAPDPHLLPFFQQLLDHSVHLHNPRFMGHQVGVVAPLTALSSMTAALLNNGMAVYEMGAASTAMERLVIQNLAGAIGFPTGAEGFLTSGGTLANLTALLAARQHQAGYDIWETGAESKLAVLVSAEAHYCVDRAARIMGFGAEGVIKVPVNDHFQMRTELLESLLQDATNRGYHVIAVVGNACSTSTGAYDDLNAIADFCETHRLWFHADGAHGGAAAFSSKYRSLILGMERADSVVVDFHKMLLCPALITALVFRDGDRSYETFSQKAQYLYSNAEDREWFNVSKRSFECTKRMMSLQVYTLLRTYGTNLFDDYVTCLYNKGRTFAGFIERDTAFELACTPMSNIVCFRWLPGTGSMAVTNATNARIRNQLTEEGDFYIVQTTLRGDLWLRVTLMNPMTGDKEMLELLDRIKKIGV